MLSSTAAGDFLPIQAVWAGKTDGSLPKANAEKMEDAIEHGFIFSSAKSKKKGSHFSTFTTMKLWVQDIVAPWRAKVIASNPDLDNDQQMICFIDIYPVHTGEEFRTYVFDEHPYIILLATLISSDDRQAEARAKVESYISDYSSLIAPIRTIPPEILSKILLHPEIHTVLELTRRKDSQSQKTVIPTTPHAAAVSHYWKSVLLATPKFWASLSHGREPAGPGYCQLWRLYLERSQTSPLSLQLPPEFWANYDLLQSLVEHTERWMRLELDSAFVKHLVDDYDHAVQGRLSSLEVLDFGHREPPGAAEMAIFKDAPRLHTLALNGSCTQEVITELPAHQIRNLTLFGLCAESWDILRRHLPNVVNLTLNFTFTQNSTPGIPPQPHAKLCVLRFNLEHSHDGLDAFNHLNTPFASHLEMSGATRWRLSPIQLFLDRSGCALQEVVLTNVKVRASDLGAFFRLVPTLNSLTLTEMPGIAVSDVLFRSLLVTESQPALLPTLSQIILTGSYLGSTSSILMMLESRSLPHEHCSPFIAVEIEHILELNILQRVMESPGGPCDQISSMYANGNPNPQDVKDLWVPLKNIINDKTLNIVFAEGRFMEVTVNYFNLIGLRADMVRWKTKEKKDDANIPHRLKAVNDYLIRTKDGNENANSLEVVARLDAHIQQAFPGTTKKVVDEWNTVHTLTDVLANPCPPAP
ncbi:hypothetical protein C8J57DRAFT_1651542 [Mycena rebaudengoi]|nr:hypothetical protein C8J57DRAFT_1651542 [Mycena rebaudengoi]